MRRDERIAELMKMARELAGGHRPQMIEAVLHANGFHEAADFIDQPHILGELRDIAEGTAPGRDRASDPRKRTAERELERRPEIDLVVYPRPLVTT